MTYEDEVKLKREFDRVRAKLLSQVINQAKVMGMVDRPRLNINMVIMAVAFATLVGIAIGVLSR